jgi:4-hydroxy-tetrahydrodipicolinate synthase
MRGVIAAIATPLNGSGAPDHAMFLDHARYLLDGGCDALNVLGTTGEATSFSLEQRVSLMQKAGATLPNERLMVGTGAAAVSEAVILTKAAADAGFAGALVLPPFYYKGVSEDGLHAFVTRLVTETKAEGIPIYLYNFPAMTGITWTAQLVARLVKDFPGRIAGLKDSSGDMDYARSIAAISPDFATFPSNEVVLLDARAGAFAGCISATANLNSAFCAKAFHEGDQAALDKASAIRALFNGKPLVAGIKAVLGELHSAPGWSQVVPPLHAWTQDEAASTADQIRLIRNA